MKTFEKHTILKGIAIGCLIAAAPSCIKSEADKPNIILILMDDLGYGDLSCYGQTTLNTLNIDKMASEGILFTDHYAGSTVCAPSRAVLMTGFHTGNVNVRVNLPPQLLGDDEPTLASVLKSAGYVTGAIGKWGVGHPPPPDDPHKKGFDYFYGYIDMFHAHNFYPEFIYRNAERIPLEGNRLYTENGVNPWSNLPDGTGVSKDKAQNVYHLLEKEALNFIQENKTETFFLYLPFNIPHANNEAGNFLNDGMEVDDYGPFEKMDWPNPEKGFARMIQYMDETVGRINDKLRELGIEKNTLVIFTNDNGPHQEGNHMVDFFDSNGQLRGMKRDLYEGGIRVPFIAKWPERIKPGIKSDHPSAFWDYLATFCDIANITAPVETDGISFLPALTGNEKKQKKHDYLYWEFYEKGGKQAIRKDKWKLIKLNTLKGNLITELYNLDDDLSEENNLVEKYPDVVKELEILMQNAHNPMEGISLFGK